MSRAITLSEASAVLQEQVLSQWQDWHRYLCAELRKLELRALADDAVRFDADETDPQAEIAKIDVQIRAIAPPRRAVFAEVYEQQRQLCASEAEQQRAQSGGVLAASTDDLEKQALERLLDRCLGDPEAGRMGLVPIRADEWYEVDPRSLDSVPDAATFAMATRQKPRPWALIAGAAVLALLWGGYIASLLRGPSATAAPSDPPQILLNGAPLASWPIAAVGIGVEQVPLVASPLWPPPDSSRAAYHTVSRWPLRVCLPRDLWLAAQDSGELSLLGRSNDPLRIYRLEAAESATADLRVSACDDPEQTQAALLHTVQLPTAQPVGARQDLAGAEIVLLDLELLSAAPTLPDDRQLVRATLRSNAALDGDLAPSLLLPDGSVIAGSRISADPASADRIVVEHLIPRLVAPTDVIWQLEAPRRGLSLRWRGSLGADSD